MKKREQRMKSVQGLHLHLDPVSGIAGDMTVAALVDAGVPPRVVIDAIAAMGVRGLRVRFETRRRGAFVGRGFVVDEPGAKPAGTLRGRPGGAKTAAATLLRRAHEYEHEYGFALDAEHQHQHGHAHEHEHEHRHHAHAEAAVPGSARKRGEKVMPAAVGASHHAHRNYADIRRLLARAKLAPDAKALAQELFARLAEVEGALHGMPVDHVSFHEVGAYDSIADIVGMAAAIAWLAPRSIGSSPPVIGTGTVRTAHGLVAVPAPATAALLQGIPMIADGEGELTTPTGAVFLATVVDAFGPPPPLRLAAIGYGAGSRELADRPNVLRAMLGEPIGQALPAAAQEVLMLESNLDDMTGQLLASLSDALFAAGALDVWSTPIIMKKGRPAQQISVLVEPSSLAEVERAFFLNSTTLGIRVHPISRSVLGRSVETVQTPYGSIGVKVAALDGTPIGASPEFEDCRREAERAAVPVRNVWAAAVAASASISGAARPVALQRRGRGGGTHAGKRANKNKRRKRSPS
ncbi:MAG: nickel pincer cofactor biosynthesis protein LarC [Myxococcales bacterium]